MSKVKQKHLKSKLCTKCTQRTEYTLYIPASRLVWSCWLRELLVLTEADCGSLLTMSFGTVSFVNSFSSAKCKTEFNNLERCLESEDECCEVEVCWISAHLFAHWKKWLNLPFVSKPFDFQDLQDPVVQRPRFLYFSVQKPFREIFSCSLQNIQWSNCRLKDFNQIFF